MIPKSGYRFRKRSCSTKKLERDGDSKKSHPDLEAIRRGAHACGSRGRLRNPWWGRGSCRLVAERGRGEGRAQEAALSPAAPGPPAAAVPRPTVWIAAAAEHCGAWKA